MRRQTRSQRSQKGAALIVGLLLLVIVTLLAVTAMGTANTELVMAGNEQFRERAFQAAETGLEMAVKKARSGDADVPMVRAEHFDTPDTVMPSEALDTYASVLTYVGATNLVEESSKAAGISFAVNATGKSRRNAQSVHDAGTWVLGPYDETNPGNCTDPPCSGPLD